MGALARFVGDEVERVDKFLKSGFQGAPSGVAAELAYNGFIVPANVDELAVAEAMHREVQEQKDSLELILMPNENCNFRCLYCYESFKHNKMRRSVIDGVVEYIGSRIHGLNELMVGWFGGEPLTAPEIIEEISSQAQSLCDRHGVSYSSSMVTNGYLLDDEIATMLLKAEVRQFQITLDGPKEHHDRLRVLGSRRGTFDRILENLVGMSRRDD
jgi:uncharacterized protein